MQKEKDVFPEMEFKGTFSRKGNLKAHLLIHTGVKPFSCEICRKQFRKNADLKNHLLRIHTNSGATPFSCDICKKTFSRNGNLKVHLLIHTGVKPFSCEICRKQFRQNGELKNHLRIHTGATPFSCDICKKTFSTPSEMEFKGTPSDSYWWQTVQL
eukprot:283561_1